jgi:hypothetical protein
MLHKRSTTVLSIYDNDHDLRYGVALKNIPR